MVNRGLHIQNPIKCHVEPRLLVSSVTPIYSHTSYRERIYIKKDILLKLAEYGEHKQKALMLFCGLTISKHRGILEEMERRDLIVRESLATGKRKSISVFKPTHNGIEFCRAILEPYEKMFPRKKGSSVEEIENIGL